MAALLKKSEEKSKSIASGGSGSASPEREGSGGMGPASAGGGRGSVPPDSNDPFEMVRQFIDVPADGSFYRQMAQTFIEEYMKMGWKDEEILALFHEPYYRGTHDILKKMGERFVKNLINEVRNV